MDDRWRKARWRWRPPTTFLLLLGVTWACVGVGVGVRGESRARLLDNGYEGVVVGVSQAVREEEGAALVEAITEVLTEASRRLYRATERRAFFREVTILVPRAWTTVNLTHQAGSESFETSDIRVDEPSGVYRQQPYTVQSGGCGMPGLHIHLTPTYLTDDKAAGWWGPRGKVFLLEWAKLRWGVFDELGYPGDPSFPLFYTEASGGRVSPTHCADQPVRGRQIDKRGRSACGVTRSGEPDQDCRFVPQQHQTATSSLLSYPLIMNDQLIHFCGHGSHAHNAEAPTKQNLLCHGRSAWDVISKHPDFKDGANPPTENFEGVGVRVVQQADATYALVLDYSGSMNDHYRVHKLRRTARRWLLHEVATGSYVAIINFSKNARLVHGMTRITDAASRRRLADAIQTKADGGTSIGAGLYVAAKKVLSAVRNPVILLITDGEENENPRIDDVMEAVLASGARVVTVAFGAEADPELEKVAEMSGGKTFTVNDIDEGQMLEDAFQGALTFQPPPPQAFQTVTIHEDEYKGDGRVATSTFNVDFTVGRNLTLRLETGAQAHRSSPSLTNPQVTSAPVLIGPDGDKYTNAQFEADSSTWTINVPLAQAGEWRWNVGLSGRQNSFVRARVTSQPRDPTVQPITTRAWVSQGAREVNASVDKVVIYAEVKQGNNPVVEADVRALVTPPNEHDPAHVYRLLDNGQGADTQAGDGIYSRYVTKYTTPGRYSVKAQVTDGGRAIINDGFHTSPQRRRRRDVNEKKKKKRKEEEEEEEEEEEMDQEYLSYFLERPAVCCGSVLPVAGDAPRTGPFDRSYSGGSFKVTSVPQGDAHAPGRVRDLQVALVGVGWARGSLPTHASLTLAWTAPGDDMDSGVVSGYELRMTPNKSELTEEHFIITTNTSSSSSSSSSWRVVDLSGLPVEVEGGTPLLLNLSLTLSSPTTYFALRTWDDAGTVSEVSNTAFVHLTAPPHSPVAAGAGLQAWAVVVVVVVVLCLLVVVAMLCLARRRTRTATEKLI